MNPLSKLLCGRSSTEPGDSAMDIMLDEMPIRDAVPHQIKKMAQLFGLTPKILSEHEWQTAWMIEQCDKCHCSKQCFTSKAGKLVDEPRIDLRDCPNFKTYRRISQSLGLRTPLHNGIS